MLSHWKIDWGKDINLKLSSYEMTKTGTLLQNFVDQLHISSIIAAIGNSHGSESTRGVQQGHLRYHTIHPTDIYDKS